MGTAVNLWPLIGVAVIIVGFILRFNPMLIVAAAAIVTGLAAHFPRRSHPHRDRHGLSQDAQHSAHHLAAAGRDRPAGTARPA